jgi:hypothetical protein
LDESAFGEQFEISHSKLDWNVNFEFEGCVILGSADMKYLGMLLIVALVVHLQCGGSCIAETMTSKTAAPTSSLDPPCHEHQQPNDSPEQNQDGFNACSQGSFIEAKAGATGKALLNVPMILPLVSHAVSAEAPFTHLSIINPTSTLVPTVATSVLRI